MSEKMVLDDSSYELLEIKLSNVNDIKRTIDRLFCLIHDIYNFEIKELNTNHNIEEEVANPPYIKIDSKDYNEEFYEGYYLMINGTFVSIEEEHIYKPTIKRVGKSWDKGSKK